MEPLWRELESELRRRLQRTVVGALPYPLVVIVAAGGGAFVLNGAYPDLVAGPVLLRDLWWAAAGSGIAVVPLLARYRRLRQEILWYHGMARVCAGLDHGVGLVSAVERAAVATPPPLGSTLEEFARHCSVGGSPAQALRIRGCPAPLVRSFTAMTGEKETARCIRKELARFAEILRARFVVLERLAPAVATSIAGAVLLWLVIRVALPVLTALTTGGLYG
jgi:type II secretory pathway component PulF